jgi:branched-chain amino acid transport system ATP-binding protein
VATLEIENLTVRYGRAVALHDVRLAIPDGEIVCLLGANGAGKTTLLNAISGLLPIAAGRILFDGRDISGLPGHHIVRRGLTHVPERRDLFPDMTVRENLMMGAYTRSDANIAGDFDQILAYFPQLRERLAQSAATLSGGEQQMLAIGRALMLRPKMMLLDEPSLGLAPQILDTIFDIVTAINREHGTAIFLVEQNTQVALAVSSFGYVLETGSIVAADEADTLLQSDLVRRSYLGISEPVT